MQRMLPDAVMIVTGHPVVSCRRIARHAALVVD